MVRFKPDVRLRFIDDRLALVLGAACVWSLVARIDVEINSINDGPGVHMATSLHYFDLAIDLDTVGDKATDLQELGEWMRRQLPPAFDVVYENDHVHVEWDAHRGPLTKKV